MRRRFGESHTVHALFQIERHRVAHDGKFLIINGQRRLRPKHCDSASDQHQHCKEG